MTKLYGSHSRKNMAQNGVNTSLERLYDTSPLSEYVSRTELQGNGKSLSSTNFLVIQMSPHSNISFDI